MPDSERSDSQPRPPQKLINLALIIAAVLILGGFGRLTTSIFGGLSYMLAGIAVLLLVWDPVGLRARMRIPRGVVGNGVIAITAALLIMFGTPQTQSGASPSSGAPTQSVATPGVTKSQPTAPAATPAPTLVAKPTAPLPTTTPTPDRAALMAALDDAWAKADWPAAEKAAQSALTAFPEDAQFKDKLFAARVNHGDLLAQGGKKAEAAKVYASAREVQPDPLIEERLRSLTPVPPTATPAPTATPVPNKALATYVDPRELVAEPKRFEGKNMWLQGKALNVAHHAEERGILTTTPDHTWIQLLAGVKDRATTESIVVEFHPRNTQILKDECYRIYGVGAGTTNVSRTLTGATNQAPLVRGYAWEPAPRGQFGNCAPP